MLFHVRMDVSIPRDLDATAAGDSPALREHQRLRRRKSLAAASDPDFTAPFFPS